MMMSRVTEQQEMLRTICAERALKLLFIGNSATYVHDLPQTLCRLATEAGYSMESASVVKGGYELAQHADSSTEHGQTVLSQIARGYDIVFLQDNGSCVTSHPKSEAARLACDALHRAIKSAGGKTYMYVRPPYGHDHGGRTPFEQCIAFDALFEQIADRISAVNAHVNRAFAYAMTHTDLDLWGPDHAHTSEYGAYLAVCVFFATLLGISAETLGTNGLRLNDARALQQIADRIAIDGVIPWNERN